MYINTIFSLTGSYIANNVKYLSKETKTIKNGIISTGRYLSNNAKTGWLTGQRLAQIKDMNAADRFYTKCAGAVKKSNIRREDLPSVLGAVGTVLPVPGGTFLGYGLGRLINKLAKK